MSCSLQEVDIKKNFPNIGKMNPERYETVKNRQLCSSSSRQPDQIPAYRILDIDIDSHGAQACSTGLFDQHPGEIKLFHYNEIPDFLKGNPWVIEGYRAFLPFGLCMKRFVTFVITMIILL